MLKHTTNATQSKAEVWYVDGVHVAQGIYIKQGVEAYKSHNTSALLVQTIKVVFNLYGTNLESDRMLQMEDDMHLVVSSSETELEETITVK